MNISLHTEVEVDITVHHPGSPPTPDYISGGDPGEAPDYTIHGITILGHRFTEFQLRQLFPLADDVIDVAVEEAVQYD